MSLIEKLKAGKRNVKIIVWPGTENRIGVRVLTEQELQEAHFATEQIFKEREIAFSSATVDAYQSEQNTQALARAIVDPESRKPLFRNADELRGLLDHPDIKAILTEEYAAWQAECSPSIKTMSEEQYEELFENVKKNGSSILNSSSIATLSGLICYLADRQTKLQTVSGSTS